MQKSLLLFLTMLLFSCTKNIVKSTDRVSTLSTKVFIEGEATRKISSNLFGYNIVYAETPDEVWNNGIIKKAKESGISAVIASDVAVMQYCNRVGVEVHLSTQLNISNSEAMKRLRKALLGRRNANMEMSLGVSTENTLKMRVAMLPI